MADTLPIAFEVYAPVVISSLRGAVPVVWPVADPTYVRLKP